MFIKVRKKQYKSHNGEKALVQLVDVSKSVEFERVRSQGKSQHLVNVTLSHEMKNPLNSILNQTVGLGFLAKNLEKFLSKISDQRMMKGLSGFSEDLKKICSAQNTASNLLLLYVNDILDFSKLRRN
mmetsp:Transcript_32808/g.50099  ORF Transcript_32808/g.50099 Transcript_32808/m.50099 type:complete len:127 (+) Transcript_32808:1553-1933(+)